MLSSGGDHGFSPESDEGTAKSLASTSGAAAASGGGWCDGESDMDTGVVVELEGRGEDRRMAAGGCPKLAMRRRQGARYCGCFCRYKELHAPIAYRSQVPIRDISSGLMTLVRAPLHRSGRVSESWRTVGRPWQPWERGRDRGESQRFAVLDESTRAQGGRDAVGEVRFKGKMSSGSSEGEAATTCSR